MVNSCRVLDSTKASFSLSSRTRVRQNRYAESQRFCIVASQVILIVSNALFGPLESCKRFNPYGKPGSPWEK